MFKHSSVIDSRVHTSILVFGVFGEVACIGLPLGQDTLGMESSNGAGAHRRHNALWEDFATANDNFCLERPLDLGYHWDTHHARHFL